MNREQGFTLVEILISLAIFAVVVVGALGVLGAAGSGGFLEGFPTGFTTTRVARDMTAASVYLQAFQEYASGVVSSTLIPGSYCLPVGCSGAQPLSLSGLGSPPVPPGQPYQLNWQRLDVTIERWYWDPTTKKYLCAQPSNPPLCTFVIPSPPTEFLVHLNSTLTWQFHGATRTLTVDRFLP